MKKNMLISRRSSYVDTSKFTATERRILRVLADGLPHTKDELFACLEDELQDKNNVSVHVSRMRLKMRPSGHDIVNVFRMGSYKYQHVRLLDTDE